MDLRNELEEVQNRDAIEARQRFEANIGNVWGHSGLGIEGQRWPCYLLKQDYMQKYL